MRRTLFLLGLACVLPLFFGFVFYPFLKYVWGRNPRYNIQAIVQKRPPQDMLKNAFLAETLNLTQEKVNFYHFNIKEAEKKLLSTIVIKDISLKKLKPHTLYIDYEMRKPMAYVADRSNTVIDEEGMLFPFAPFYTPKHLPEIYFGGDFSKEVWGRSMQKKKMGIVKEILSLFPPYSISWIDVSHIEAASLGQKEIIVEYRSCLLRLSPKRYVEEIKNFFLLEKHLKELTTCTVDLRLPNVAFFH